MAVQPITPQDTIAGSVPSAPPKDMGAPIAPTSGTGGPIKFSGTSPGGDPFKITIDFAPETD